MTVEISAMNFSQNLIHSFDFCSLSYIFGAYVLDCFWMTTLQYKFLVAIIISYQIEDHTLMDFANTVVSHDTHSVMSLMAHLHNMAAPEAAQRAAALEETMVYLLIIVVLFEYCYRRY